MATRYTPGTCSTTKTYATEANAEKAALAIAGKTEVRYIVMKADNGRYVPVFIGQDALTGMFHFHAHVLA